MTPAMEMPEGYFNIEVRDSENCWVVRMMPDGSIDINPKFTASEAGAEFVRVVREISGRIAPSAAPKGTELVFENCFYAENASSSAEAAQPVAMDWPHLVQLGRCLGLFASGIKAVGEWSKFYQSEYDKANLALQEVFKELAALSQPQGELREALTQVEGACLRIEMVSQAMRKGDPSSGLLNEAVATIRAALAGRTAG
jgi:hypothetical protein